MDEAMNLRDKLIAARAIKPTEEEVLDQKQRELILERRFLAAERFVRDVAGRVWV
jgi:hypothetical protein